MDWLAEQRRILEQLSGSSLVVGLLASRLSHFSTQASPKEEDGQEMAKSRAWAPTALQQESAVLEPATDTQIALKLRRSIDAQSILRDAAAVATKCQGDSEEHPLQWQMAGEAKRRRSPEEQLLSFTSSLLATWVPLVLLGDCLWESDAPTYGKGLQETEVQH